MFNEQHDSSDRSPLLRLTDGVIALELIWPFPLMAVGVLGISDPLVAGVAVILALMPWPARLLVFGRPTRQAFVGGGLGLLVVGALVGMWATYDPALSWPMLLTLLGSVCFFFAIVNSPRSPWPVASGLVMAAGLVALYFVGQYAHFGYRWEMGRLARLGRMTGSLMPDLVFFVPHPNAVAGLLEGALLLNLALIWRARGGRRWAWGVVLVVIAYGLLVSESRGAWVGLAVVMGIGVLLLVPSRAFRLTLAAAGIAGSLLATYAAVRLVTPDRQIIFLSSALNTVGNRLLLYRNSLYLLGDYPFTGIGLGDTFAMVYSRYQLLISVPFLTYSHNLFLSVGLGQGALGLVALAWLLIGFYRFVVRVERAGLRVRSLLLFRAAWLGATATFIHGLIDSPQFSDSRWTMPMLFALLGLAVATGRPALIRLGQREIRRRRGWVALGMVVVALALAATVFRQPLVSAWYANLGAIYQTRADLSPDLDETARGATMARAVTYFERALSLDPSQPVANRRLGIMALDRGDFDAAIAYLERAYSQEPGNQVTLKALGYAYLWAGRLDPAEGLFRQLDARSELIGELKTWRWWWGTQGREDLSDYAEEMVRRLSGER